jgi:hypothetical protein
MGRQKIQSVVIALDVKNSLIRHEVRRSINHRCMLTCATASGDALCPVIIASRKDPEMEIL